MPILIKRLAEISRRLDLYTKGRASRTTRTKFADDLSWWASETYGITTPIKRGTVGRIAAYHRAQSDDDIAKNGVSADTWMLVDEYLSSLASVTDESSELDQRFHKTLQAAIGKNAQPTLAPGTYFLKRRSYLEPNKVSVALLVVEDEVSTIGSSSVRRFTKRKHYTDSAGRKVLSSTKGYCFRTDKTDVLLGVNELKIGDNDPVKRLSIVHLLDSTKRQKVIVGLTLKVGHDAIPRAIKVLVEQVNNKVADGFIGVRDFKDKAERLALNGYCDSDNLGAFFPKNVSNENY